MKQDDINKDLAISAAMARVSAPERGATRMPMMVPAAAPIVAPTMKLKALPIRVFPSY